MNGIMHVFVCLIAICVSFFLCTIYICQFLYWIVDVYYLFVGTLCRKINSLWCVIHIFTGWSFVLFLCLWNFNSVLLVGSWIYKSVVLWFLDFCMILGKFFSSPQLFLEILSYFLLILLWVYFFFLFLHLI